VELRRRSHLIGVELDGNPNVAADGASAGCSGVVLGLLMVKCRFSIAMLRVTRSA
jgi:hypothetical protein